MSFFKRWFSGTESSRDIAKKRLQLLLIHDQVDLTPDQMSEMKREIVDVIERYICIDTDETHIVLNRLEQQIRLVGSIPIEGERRKAR